jgi:hypothetical protein
MSTVHDTTNLKPYKVHNRPALDESLLPYSARELQLIAASLNQIITALKSIEARIVAGGL